MFRNTNESNKKINRYHENKSNRSYCTFQKNLDKKKDCQRTIYERKIFAIVSGQMLNESEDDIALNYRRERTDKVFKT